MREATSSHPTELYPTRLVEVVESHYEGLKYLAWAKGITIRQLVGRAVKQLLKDEGVYLSPKMLERCPFVDCQQPLNDRTVSKHLLKKRIWACDRCYCGMNRTIEIRTAEKRRTPVARRERAGTFAR